MDDLSADEIREYRGTLTEPGRRAPTGTGRWRRTSTSSADAGRRVRGRRRVLRAKIDMASRNLNLRDPVLYRIRKATHHRTGRPVVHLPDVRLCALHSDALEGITHSLCTLEFEDHRPLYDWFLRRRSASTTRSRSSSRGSNVSHTVMSKRQAARSSWRRATSAAGTTRECRRCAGCAGAGTRRRRSANFCEARRRGQARQRRRRRPARALPPRRPEPTIAPRRWQCCARCVSSSRTTRRGRSRSWTRSTTRRIRARGRVAGPVLAGALHRAGRLPREPAQEVLPPRRPAREVRLRYAYFITCTGRREGRGHG